ncbi:hypothetical protein D3C85_1790500 [compost metagenome]
MESNPHAPPWPGNGPDDKPQHWQARDQQHPEDFHPGSGVTFNHVDDGLDIQNENDQGNQAVERRTHGVAP